MAGPESGSSATPPQTPSIQEQLNEVRSTQQRILQELKSIKTLLQERNIRSESAARPATNLISMNVHGEPFKGEKRARVAIIEYSDFDCVFCGRYSRELFPKLVHEYVESGKVKYYFRDLPAPGDTNAMVKARAARCAGDQGKFWEMHDRLFADQSGPESTNFPGHAQALGLDLEGIEACLHSGKYEENIRRSIVSARRVGVYGTPAFIIGKISDDGDFVRDARLLVGGESYESLHSALEELLSESESKGTH